MSAPPSRPAPLLRGVGHVAVATEDLRRLAGFYRDVFGAEVVGHRTDELGGGPEHAFIRIGATTVQARPRSGVRPRPDRPLHARGARPGGVRGSVAAARGGRP